MFRSFFKNKDQEIVEAHRKIGFPKFSMEEQVQFVFERDYSLISQLTEFKKVPVILLDFYVFLTPDYLSNFLLKSDYIKSLCTDESNKTDGFWILSNGHQFSLIEQERGVRYFEKKFNDLESISMFLSNKLLARIPKYSNVD